MNPRIMSKPRPSTLQRELAGLRRAAVSYSTVIAADVPAGVVARADKRLQRSAASFVGAWLASRGLSIAKVK